MFKETEYILDVRSYFYETNNALYHMHLLIRDADILLLCYSE